MPEVGFEDLLGLGLAPRTAYHYARMIDLAVSFLQSRGTDLASCRAPDVAAFAQTVKDTYSARQLCRSALRAAWDVLGRYDGSARAVRVPPRPRMRCRALEEDLELDGAGRPVWFRVAGKGGQVADVPVHPVLADAFIPVMARTGWIFPGRPTTIWSYVRTVALDAGLLPVRTHQLRHTALAEANDRTGNLRTVQEFARHARPEQTAGYTRVTARQLQHVVASIDYGRRPGGEAA